MCSIRANQGHSTDVKINFEEVKPPTILYHGAPVGVIDAIMKEGLKKMNRHHVHLSPDRETAAKVGSRRGKFEILEIEAMRLRADGHKIYMSANGVYLTDEVPPEYIRRNEKG
jgi:putative RNA 2'-phosphotransferase